MLQVRLDSCDQAFWKPAAFGCRNGHQSQGRSRDYSRSAHFRMNGRLYAGNACTYAFVRHSLVSSDEQGCQHPAWVDSGLDTWGLGLLRADSSVTDHGVQRCEPQNRTCTTRLLAQSLGIPVALIRRIYTVSSIQCRSKTSRRRCQLIRVVQCKSVIPP